LTWNLRKAIAARNISSVSLTPKRTNNEKFGRNNARRLNKILYSLEILKNNTDVEMSEWRKQMHAHLPIPEQKAVTRNLKAVSARAFWTAPVPRTLQLKKPAVPNSI
jgi:hypothetical protein